MRRWSDDVHRGKTLGSPNAFDDTSLAHTDAASTGDAVDPYARDSGRVERGTWIATRKRRSAH
jgi:hypothetical protein